MAGGLMQLVAYGAQDVYLTGNPEVTFFQAKYKRHTNFAMENIEQTVNGTAANSGRVSVTVARNGDLVGDMYVELKSTCHYVSTAEVALTATGSPSVRSTTLSFPSVVSVSTSTTRSGGVCTPSFTSIESKKATWGKMTTACGRSNVYLPLIFFFNRNPGLALPLIALQYHEVRIDFDLASEFETYTRQLHLQGLGQLHLPRHRGASSLRAEGSRVPHRAGSAHWPDTRHRTDQAGPPLVQPPSEGACVVLLRVTRPSLPVELHHALMPIAHSVANLDRRLQRTVVSSPRVPPSSAGDRVLTATLH